MKILFECECGTSVHMPEKFAREGCRCPCCGNEMLPAEPTIGEGRIEVPVVEEPRENARDRSPRKTKKPPAQPPHLQYRTTHPSRVFMRVMGLLGALIFVVVVGIWFIGRPTMDRKQQPNVSDTQKERIALKPPSEEQRSAEASGPKDTIAEATGRSTETVPSIPPGQGEPASPTLAVAPQTDHTSQRSSPQKESSLGPDVSPSSSPISSETSPTPASPGTSTPASPPGKGQVHSSATKQPRTPEAKEPQPAHAPQPKGKYTLTLASFKDKDRAIAYRNTLRKKNLDAFEWPVAISGQGTWYRVSVGRFTTRTAAQLYARTVESTLGTKPIVSEMP